MFYGNLKQICAENGTTPTGVCKELGVPSSHLGLWKKGGKPGDELLARIATELKCTRGRLLFGDENPAASTETEKAPAEAGAESALDLEILRSTAGLSEDAKRAVLVLIAELQRNKEQ